MSSPPLPRIGIAVSTLGRPSLSALLRSAAESTYLPTAFAIADHTPTGDLHVTADQPFPVHVVPSTGGASTGRNDAAAALTGLCDVVAFPNDDNQFASDTLRRVAEAFASAGAADAVAGTLDEPGGPRYRLPPVGTRLNRRTVWLAIEPATFLRLSSFSSAGGFRNDLGTGASTPWQSGDGTDLLLTLLAGGGTVISRPEIVVRGPGERKGLSPEKLVAKHRAYARGTGHVYRTHRYPPYRQLMVAVAPLLRATSHDPSLRLSLRLAVARTVGRIEGLAGRPLPGSKELRWWS